MLTRRTFAQLLIVFVCSGVLAACDKLSSEPGKTATGYIDLDHSSMNALDWAGSYEGILPCADCEGIKTVLTLHDNLKYQLQTEYLGKEPLQYQENGHFVWSDDGSSIRLLSEDGSATERQFQIGENRIWQLDLQGQRITGSLEQYYQLDRVSAAGSPAPALTAGEWKLIELMGEPVAPESGIYLRFNHDMSVHGFTGCNQLAGSYQTEANQLSFGEMITTHKACLNGVPESTLLEALQNADSYRIEASQLILSRSGFPALARFGL